MGRAANPSDDNWFGVQDPRKRKQIQDRLAQRARRKRLADYKNPVSSTSESDVEQNGGGDDSSAIKARRGQRSPSLIRVIPRSPPLYEALLPTSNPDRFVTGSVTGSVYGALFNNGSLMGISCGTSIPNISRHPGPEIPESLRPTQLQLTTIHPLWIDRFPFPKMRDNMITLLGIINEEEFLADLFCMTSFTLEPGAAPWDPAAWKVGREFSEKWGYLFY